MDLSSLDMSRFVDDRVSVGSIFYMHVGDTIPPKRKFFVVIGFDEFHVSLASVYINSNVNTNVISTPELVDLQVQIDKDDCPFLDHTSHVDCSHIKARDTASIQAYLNSNRLGGFIATMPEHIMLQIKEKIKVASTIPVIDKRQFGFL